MGLTKRTLSLTLCFIALMIPVMSGHAAIVYVSDQLRVGVRSEPDSSVAPVGVVLTGMKLEVLERSSGYVKITTEDGTTGWIKDIYVSRQAPAIIELKKLKAQKTKLSNRIATLMETAELTEETNKVLIDQFETIKSENSKLRLQQAKALGRLNLNTGSKMWWVFGILGGVFAGFVGGILWQRHQTIKRLGGLRI